MRYKTQRQTEKDLIPADKTVGFGKSMNAPGEYRVDAPGGPGDENRCPYGSEHDNS